MLKGKSFRGQMLNICVIAGLMSSQLFGGEVDVLVNKLIDKGVLTAGEGTQIKYQTQEEVKKALVSGESESAPKWTQKINLKGDFRFRYQWDQLLNNNLEYDRARWRVRLRLGGDAKVTQNTAIAFGLATGGTDSRSTNQDLKDNFATKTIMLDYVYAYSKMPCGSTLYLGKMPNSKTIWTPADLLWDGDISVEGIALNNKTGKIFTNLGYYVLNENNYTTTAGEYKTEDAVLYNAQVGVEKLELPIGSLTAGVSYYKPNYVQDPQALTQSKKTNTKNMQFDVVSFGFNYEMEEILLAKIGIFGEYVKNNNGLDEKINGKYLGNSDDKEGYLLGLKLLNCKKVSDKGDWEFKAMLRNLGKDSWLDSYPDSDTYDGKTGIKGYELIFNYGLTKNIVLGLDYYNTGLRDGSKKLNLLQIDLNYKF